MKNPRVWLWVIILVIVAGVVLAARNTRTGATQSAESATPAPAQPSLAPGAPAPQFTAATNHGYFDLAKTNKPVFLEVFATWCPHCQRQTAVIDQLYAHYKNSVAFVAVTGSNTGMDHQSPSSELDVLNFAQTFHIQYPVAYDGSLDVAHKYLQGYFPTMVIINRKKVVTYVTTGETSYDELGAALDSALKSP